MKTAFITGISGQDGSYMAELLLAKGYRIVGTVKDIRYAERALPPVLKGRVELVPWNMLNQSEMIDVLTSTKPTEFYNFAAYSSGAGMYDDPVGIAEVNGVAVVRMLEAIREVDKSIRFCQASSREIFGEASESPQTECTAVNPRSPYGAAKLYADSMIRIYRQRYGLFACSAILYNHESPRRGLNFVTRKITHEAVKIKLGQSEKLCLGDLHARRDWGFAGDYVRAMWLMLQREQPDDFVIATGKTHSVQELCECVFGYLGLNYLDYVREDAGECRPPERIELVGCADKARNELNWSPEVSFGDMLRMMVDSDIQILGNLIRQ